MLKEERHQLILEKLQEKSRIHISTLCNELNVSDDTLRRDLSELEHQGLLTKVHGGAIPKSGIPLEFSGRLNTRMEEKHALAAKVIPLFRSGDVILIDGGTTNLEVARQLPFHIPLTIVTNSFPIASELMNRSNIEVIFLGGTVFSSSQVTVGIAVYQALQTVKADWLILGVCSVHPKLGLSGPEHEEAMLKRLMIEHASKTLVIAESGKLNTAENYIIGALGDIDYLVVEDKAALEIENSWPKSQYILL